VVQIVNSTLEIIIIPFTQISAAQNINFMHPFTSNRSHICNNENTGPSENVYRTIHKNDRIFRSCSADPENRNLCKFKHL